MAAAGKQPLNMHAIVKYVNLKVKKKLIEQNIA